MARRILIFGEHGQMALALARACTRRGDVVLSLGRSSVDIADKPAVISATTAFRPDLVVNTAAYTGVDRAEDEADAAFRVNRDGASHVAAAAAAAAVPVIHLSTDYVFDGNKAAPYLETDEANPINLYGRSKLEGEAAVAAANERHIILRTSWLYGPEGHNFVKTMLRLARQGDEIRVVDDQWGTPTFAPDLAAGIIAVGERMCGADGVSGAGIYHGAGSSATTWFRFARAILSRSAEMGAPACRVSPISTREFPTRARRPADSRLDSAKLERVFGIRLAGWETALEHCLEQLIAVT
jgi:dTDP-4-dehydrorhamnose reductase